jgi:hypothetical protein
MKTRSFLLASCAAILLSTGIAQAGPCNTANKDAGSGPTPGHTAETTTTTTTGTAEHPATGAMNKAAGDAATSSQDTQRQMQGHPTTAQEAQGAKAKTGNDC